jgi:glycosyltransferase involved in cell wall biosynthesis
MRLAVIAHALKGGGGVSVGKNLIQALSRVAQEHTYLFVVPGNVGYETLNLSGPDHRVKFFEANGGYARRWLFDKLSLPRLIREFRPDVVLGLGNRGLAAPPCPQAILCQDAHLFYPRKHFGNETVLLRLLISYNRWVLQRCLSRTALLLCQTPVAGSRLRETYTYRGPIAQLPNAVSADLSSEGVHSTIPAALQNAEHLLKLFCLARYYPYKNIEGIVHMFAKYSRELKDVIVILTVAATDHPNARKLLRSIDELNLGKHFWIVGPLKQQELAEYYRHCDALFMPTLLESFSGTYLEAMQFGCPILTSDLDFARYICGDAAIYFDPWDIESMKNAVLELKKQPDLKAQMVAKGKERLGMMFRTWDEIARNLCKDLQTIAQG